MKNKATWIWYPGDFEISLFNRCMARRYERNVQITPFWRMDSHFVTVKFYANFVLGKEDRIYIKADGTFNIFIDKIGYIRDFKGYVDLGAGEYEMQILVNNVAALPCIYVEGEQLKSNKESFRVTCQDNVFYPAASWIFDSPDDSPNAYRLPVKETAYLKKEVKGGGILYDFGREMTACVRFDGAQAPVYCYYGESREEALDKEHSEQTDVVVPEKGIAATECTKAFRYLFALSERPYQELVAIEEAPDEPKCSFKCEDKKLQEIFDVSLYTFGLCKKEFILDGVKRDRWTWSGDVYQSALVNYYSHFDTEVVKRSLRALKGKDPINAHINHITDYTLYWILSLCDYYRYTADKEFIGEMLPWAEKYMNFLAGRADEDGFLYYHADDWMFIDWAPMDNRGITSFEQVLYAAALKGYAELCKVCGKDGCAYFEASEALWKKTVERFWREGRFLHGEIDGVQTGKVTRYANLFAVLYGFADKKMREDILRNVLLNPDVQAITTPYMKFYELKTMAEYGLYGEVMQSLRSYWGGMLVCGATTFWEAFDPAETGAEKYAMYGRRYGKSLCHAWGASPVYLLAAYVVGVMPKEGGFVCRPKLSVLPPFEFSCPIAGGKIKISYDGKKVLVEADGCNGELFFEKGSGFEEGSIEIESGKKYSFERVKVKVCRSV